jgi:hypothetical protein
MKTLISLLITLVGIGGEPTPRVEPEAAQRCIGSTRTVLGRIETLVRADPTFELHAYSDALAAVVLENFNSDPPATQYAADRILALVDTGNNGDQNVLVMLMYRGCLEEIVQVPRKHWQALLSKSIGNDA